MGAVPPLAYTYASLFGVVTEEEYPYTSGDPWGQGDDENCMFDATETPVSVMTMTPCRRASMLRCLFRSALNAMCNPRTMA